MFEIEIIYLFDTFNNPRTTNKMIEIEIEIKISSYVDWCPVFLRLSVNNIFIGLLSERHIACKFGVGLLIVILMC